MTVVFSTVWIGKTKRTSRRLIEDYIYTDGVG